MNPYWLSLKRSLEYMWNSILSIINLSNNLPPIFSRLIGRYIITVPFSRFHNRNYNRMLQFFRKASLL
jgi:hypothetical protein